MTVLQEDESPGQGFKKADEDVLASRPSVLSRYYFTPKMPDHVHNFQNAWSTQARHCKHTHACESNSDSSFHWVFISVCSISVPSFVVLIGINVQVRWFQRFRCSWIQWFNVTSQIVQHSQRLSDIEFHPLVFFSFNTICFDPLCVSDCSKRGESICLLPQYSGQRRSTP